MLIIFLIIEIRYFEILNYEISCGDGGAFQIYYKGPLAIDSGMYQTVEGGYKLPVPLFINEGDIIRINTETGEYNDRTATK